MADSKKKQAFTLQHILIFLHVFSTLCNLGRFHPRSSVKVLVISYSFLSFVKWWILLQMYGVQIAAHHQGRADWTLNFTITIVTGFVQSLEFLKKSWNLSSKFPDLEKVWKIERKSWKTIKSQGFFFESYNKCFIKDIFFVLLKSYSVFSACMFAVHHKKSFVPAVFLRSRIITTGKRNYCFGKSLGKVLNFASKNLYEPCGYFIRW